METGFDLYKAGIAVAGWELNDSLGHVDTIFEDWKAERATRQPDFWGEVYYQKVPKYIVPPELSVEDEHLCRPVELKNGVTKSITHAWGRYGK